jgi:glycerophosphoryl diester phosphodiesterase
VQSFDADDLRRTHRADPRLPLAFLAETRQQLALALELPYAAVHLEHVMLDEAVCRQLRALGKSIGVWTVNAEADVRRTVKLGVEVVITDEPAMVRRVVDELCGPG